MPIFRVWYTVTASAFTDIEADTIEEAMDKSEELGGECFDKSDSEWELDEAFTLEYNEEVTK